MSFKTFASQHLLSAYSVHCWAGRWNAKACNEQDLFPAFQELTVLWGGQISTEIIQNVKKGTWQAMSVGAESGSSQQKFIILSISATVHVAFISFAKERIKIP